MKSRYALMGSLLLAILATIGIRKILEGDRKQRQIQEQPTLVLVAAQDLVEGTLLKETDLAEDEIPSRFFDKSMVILKTRDTVVGKKLKVSLAKGSFLRFVDVEERQDAARLPVIPTGKRLFTISVDLQSGVGGHLAPGSVVDCIAVVRDAGAASPAAANTAPGRSGPEGTRAVTILEGVRVFTVGPLAIAPSGYAQERGNYSAATLIVTPAEAELLAFAQSQGRLILAERSALDALAAELSARGVTLSNFDALIQNRRREGR